MVSDMRCQVCTVPLGDVHAQTKYCDRCRIIVFKEQAHNYQVSAKGKLCHKRYRDKLSKKEKIKARMKCREWRLRNVEKHRAHSRIKSKEKFLKRKIAWLQQTPVQRREAMWNFSQEILNEKQ